MSSQIATGRRGKRGQLGIGTPTTRESLTGFWTQRVAKIKWEWFVTLTFRRIDIPLWIAKRSFKDWIWEIENEVGRERFRWFGIIEYGSKGRDLRFHVLVSGLRSASKYPWILRWQELLAGDAEIVYAVCAGFGGVTKFIKTIARSKRHFEVDSYGS